MQEYEDIVQEETQQHLSLSTIVLNSRDWYEIIWLLENFML